MSFSTLIEAKSLISLFINDYVIIIIIMQGATRRTHWPVCVIGIIIWTIAIAGVITILALL